jgi:hypothetical protein
MCKFHKQLRKLPPYIQSHYLEVCGKIESGVRVQELDAKQLARFKDGVRRLSVRLSSSHRVVLQMTSAGFSPEWIGTHQGYDKWITR